MRITNVADPDKLSAWYDLLLRVFSDMRGAAFQAEKARLKNFQDLFNCFREIHNDYVGLFVAFKYGLQAGSDPDAVDQVKARFLDGRILNSRSRTLALIDVEALDSENLSIEERAFLLDVRGYLAVRESPFGGAGSLSSLFWIHIKQETDANVLLQDCEKALDIIAAAFKRLVASYAKIDPTFRLGGETIENGDRT